jgi:hypothetical protein
MKNIIFGFAVMGLFAACDNSQATIDSNAQPADTGKSITAAQVSKTSTPTIQDVITGYLHIKNALAADNAKDAAAGGKMLAGSIAKVDVASLDSSQQATLTDVREDMQEHAEHISMNEGKIAHQREHFDMLSKDLYDLVKAVAPGQTLYQDHCPMYNKGKGANWLSEVKDIKNPYLGLKMPECGEVKETIAK